MVWIFLGLPLALLVVNDFYQTPFQDWTLWMYLIGYLSRGLENALNDLFKAVRE